MDLTIIEKIFPLEKNIDNKTLLKYDKEGLWSITNPDEADQISKIILNKINGNQIIFDGTAGLGGNTLSFAKYFKQVLSIEKDEIRFNLLKDNVESYSLQNITLINDNCINHLTTQCDCYFFDPPWGGPNYKYQYFTQIKLEEYSLSQLVNIIYTYHKKPIFFKLPNNYDLNEFKNFNYNITKIHNYQLISIC